MNNITHSIKVGELHNNSGILNFLTYASFICDKCIIEQYLCCKEFPVMKIFLRHFYICLPFASKTEDRKPFPFFFIFLCFFLLFQFILLFLPFLHLSFVFVFSYTSLICPFFKKKFCTPP